MTARIHEGRGGAFNQSMAGAVFDVYWIVWPEVTAKMASHFLFFLFLHLINGWESDEANFIHAPVVWQPAALWAANDPQWALDRMDQRSLPLDGRYRARGNGTGWTVWVVDSGIDCHRADLAGAYDGGVAMEGADACSDRFGHGTMVASVILMMAPAVRLRSVKVLNDWGMGSTDGLVRGLNWLADGAIVDPSRSIVNLSLGSGRLRADLANAIQRLADLGVLLVAAAGNEGKPTGCGFYPASLPGVQSVGATMSNDSQWPAGNKGPCVDWFAPGHLISAAGRVASGTSFSAPFASGAVAAADGMENVDVYLASGGSTMLNVGLT
jgi:hypothetical protein